MKEDDTKLSIADKLFYMGQALSYSNAPNVKKLKRDHEKLTEIFNSTFNKKSILETIKAIKSNLCYQEFKLEDDPQFFETIIEKVDDPFLMHELLKIKTYSEIIYSKVEQEILNQRLFKLILLFKFENTLKQETGLFYNTYCADLNKLKELLFSERIKCENLEWFLKSNFFKLVHDSSPSFKTSLDNIFLTLLKNLPATENIDPIKKIITDEKNRKRTNNMKNEKIINIPRRKINHNFFNSTALTPIAKVALVNNLKKI